MERYYKKKPKLEMSPPKKDKDTSSSSKQSQVEINLADLPADPDLLDQMQHIQEISPLQSDPAQNEVGTFFRASVSCVRYLVRQGLAFPEPDEYEPDEYLVDTSNKGLFLNLLTFIAYAYGNEDVKAVLAMEDTPAKNLELAAADLQKDIMTVAAFETSNEIFRDLGDAPFSVLIDETPDKEDELQMVVAIRYVDKKGQVIEQFLGIGHVTDKGALSHKRTVEDLFCRLGLSISRLRGQGYGRGDNFTAHVKAGLNGLKALILEDNPFAYYVNSFAYKLQSALVAVAKDHIDMATVFYWISKLVNVVGAPCKHQDIPREEQAAKIVEALSIGEILSSPWETQIEYYDDTRSGSHYSALVNLIDMFASVIEELDLILEDGSRVDDQTGANCLFNGILTFDYIFSLHLMKTVLGITNELSLALQIRVEGIVNAMELLPVSISRLHTMRESGWTSLLDDVSSFGEKHEIKVPNMDDMYKVWRRREVQEITNLHHYQVEVFWAVIDLQIQELDTLFTESSIELLLCVACLSPSNSFSRFDKNKFIRLAEFYPKEFSPIELTVLHDQLDTYILDVRSSNAFSRLNTISDLGEKMVETGKDKIYPLVYLLLTLALILPVAIPKRVFSGMNIVKNRLRNEMGDQWMSDRLVVYIEDDIFEGIDNDNIIESLKKMKPRWADCKRLH